MKLYSLVILFVFGANVYGNIPVCRFILWGKCLGDLRQDNDNGFPDKDAGFIIKYNDTNFESCKDFCNLNVDCHMAAFEEQHCTLYKNPNYTSTPNSPIHLYLWPCCNTEYSYQVPNRCPGFWNVTQLSVSDNKERISDPLVQYDDMDKYQCMLRCLEIDVCGAINVARDNVKSVCQLIIQFPVDSLYTMKNSSIETYQWTCASNYSILEPSQRCVPRKHYSDGHWIVQNTSITLGNNIEILIEFFTLDYRKCLDNCALYRDCIRTWYSLSGFFCLLEASNRSSCKDHSSNSKYTFTTFVWYNCDNKQFFTINNIDFSLNDCRTLENTEGVFIYPIKCGYTPINVSKLYSCSDNNSGRDGITFSYSLQCQKNQSFRVLDRVVTSMFGFKNSILYRIFTGYESFWLVNATDQKFRLDKRINRCKAFDSSMDVSGMNELKIVKRTEWFPQKPLKPEQPFPSHAVPYVIISDTENPGCNCFTIEACSSIMRRLDILVRPTLLSLAYNFIVTGNGMAYETRGWDLESQVASEFNRLSFSIALCGQYHHTPNVKSLSSVKQLINMAIKLKKVSDNYTLYMYNDLMERKYPYAGLRRVIALWPRYRGHIIPDCQPITSHGLIMNIVSCILCLLVITLLFDRFVFKIWHKSQCFLFRKCRIDTIYSNACESDVEVLPKTVMHTIGDLNLDKKYFSTFVSPVYWIEDSQTVISGRSTVEKCCCCSAIFAVLDLCRVQNKLVNVGSLRLLPEVRCCSNITGFVFQLKEELGDEYLVILHFLNRKLFYKCITNLYENKCACSYVNMITYRFSMCYNVTGFKNLQESINTPKINPIKRNHLQDKYTFLITSDGIVIDY